LIGIVADKACIQMKVHLQQNGQICLAHSKSHIQLTDLALSGEICHIGIALLVEE